MTSKDTNVEEEERFKYLLSVIDSIEPRRLQCTGQLYAIILSEGAHKGGLFKKIASLLQISRTESLGIKMEVDSGNEPQRKQIKSSWVNLFDNYVKYKDSLEEVDLPAVRVRINQKEIRQVLLAEQSVTYNATRKGRRRKKTTSIS